MTPKQRIKASKFLSLLLRHKPDVGGITLDKNGWANTKEIVNALRDRGFPMTITILKEIVSADSKQRYVFGLHDNTIRANQGHSIDVDLGLVSVQPPEFLYHGTSEKSVSSIFHYGILAKGRQYVHLSKDIDTAHTVGKRHGNPVILCISSLLMADKGFEFYCSENGVWLTSSVPVGYFIIL